MKQPLLSEYITEYPEEVIDLIETVAGGIEGICKEHNYTFSANIRAPIPPVFFAATLSANPDVTTFINSIKDTDSELVRKALRHHCENSFYDKEWGSKGVTKEAILDNCSLTQKTKEVFDSFIKEDNSYDPIICFHKMMIYILGETSLDNKNMYIGHARLTQEDLMEAANTKKPDASEKEDDQIGGGGNAADENHFAPDF